MPMRRFSRLGRRALRLFCAVVSGRLTGGSATLGGLVLRQTASAAICMKLG
jgi:hypothetical protein